MREGTTAKTTARLGTRTPDPLIKSQLLGITITDEQTTYTGSPTDPAYNPDTQDGSARESADLRAVVDAWPELPEAIRVGIVAMVKAAGKTRALDPTTKGSR